MNATSNEPCFECGAKPTLPLGRSPTGSTNHVHLCPCCDVALAAMASSISNQPDTDSDDYQPTAEEVALRDLSFAHSF